MHPTTVLKASSVLEDIFKAITKNASKKEMEELNIYDNVEFNDVNHEIGTSPTDTSKEKSNKKSRIVRLNTV